MVFSWLQKRFRPPARSTRIRWQIRLRKLPLCRAGKKPSRINSNHAIFLKSTADRIIANINCFCFQNSIWVQLWSELILAAIAAIPSYPSWQQHLECDSLSNFTWFPPSQLISWYPLMFQGREAAMLTPSNGQIKYFNWVLRNSTFESPTSNSINSRPEVTNGVISATEDMDNRACHAAKFNIGCSNACRVR